jgi:hypothetical protein
MSVELLKIKHFKVNKNKISFSNKIIQILQKILNSY